MRLAALISWLIVVPSMMTSCSIAMPSEATEPDPSTQPFTEQTVGKEGVDLDQIKEDSVRAMFDSNGRMLDPDRRLADVAREHEGGFGGYYFHETDKGVVFVYMQDVSKRAAAEAAFRAAYGGDREITQIIPVQGNYSFDQLLTWFRLLDRALIESGILPVKASVREIENRIWIGLRDESQPDEVRRIMKGLGIPYGAVIVK